MITLPPSPSRRLTCFGTVAGIWRSESVDSSTVQTVQSACHGMPMNEAAVEWREICRRAVAQQREALEHYVGSAVSAQVASAGASGDVTLQIDSDFEAIIVSEIRQARGTSSRATRIVTEELGTIMDGDPDSRDVDWVIIDPGVAPV